MASSNLIKNSFSFISFFFGLTIIIGIHELGHFTFAKIFKIPVPNFSIGFGPTILSKKIGDTNFKLAAIPMGGYTQIAGMGDTNNLKYQTNSFANKFLWQQLLILFGGVLFNFIFAYLIIIFLALIRGENLLQALSHGIKQANFLIKETWKSLKNIFNKEKSKEIPQQIKEIVENSTAINHPSYLFLFFLAALSLNLAVFNLIPIPILDGGQIVIYTLQAFMGHSLSFEIRAILAIISWLLAFGLMIYLSFRDIKIKKN